MEKRNLAMVILLMALALVLSGFSTGALASKLVPQTPFPGANFTKFLDPMPVFGPGTNGVDPPGLHPRLSGKFPVQVTYNEALLNPLPNNFLYPAGFTGTYVWGYELSGSIETSPGVFAPFTSLTHWPGFTIEVQRGTPTTVHYINGIPNPAFLQSYLTVDQTIHWADPLGQMLMRLMTPYTGPLPVVTHLHGGEVQSEFDGGPEQWFTNAANLKGADYRTAVLADVNTPAATYHYLNGQEATTLWYHDHALGITRLNVYGGLAAFYLIRDNLDTGLVNNPMTLPGGPNEMEIVIQDRQFDTNGQLLFPDGFPAGLNGPPPNPSIHPFWNPEFFGDTIAVNGELWPFLKVDARRYRFRLLNGSNARFYNLAIGSGNNALPFYVIGTDGGFLDAPVKVNQLLIAPGERYDVIVDFAPVAGTAAAPTLITMTNSAKAPFPGGAPPSPQTVAQIMQFRVNPPVQGFVDSTFNPALAGATLRALNAATKPAPIERLVNPTRGTLAPGVTVDKKRQLVLREIAGPGGPIEVLLNNTKWSGLRELDVKTGALDGAVPTSSALPGGNWSTELPAVGSTEVWEIINTTADAHPIHIHLVQFQLMNRQSFKLTQYVKAYTAAFAANGAPTIDGYGPPNPYNVLNADGALGGNPAVSPFLQGAAMPPNPQEAGWKDTVIMHPGQVTRIVVRWAPQDTPVGTTVAGTEYYGFDATGRAPVAYNASGQLDFGPGYVWHCHILDHEDNEMMRPYIPVSNMNNAYP